MSPELSEATLKELIIAEDEAFLNCRFEEARSMFTEDYEERGYTSDGKVEYSLRGFDACLDRWAPEMTAYRSHTVRRDRWYTRAAKDGQSALAGAEFSFEFKDRDGKESGYAFFAMYRYVQHADRLLIASVDIFPLE